MSEIELQVNESGQIILFEVTVEVRNLAVKMLFNQPPVIAHVCQKIMLVFKDNIQVATGLAAYVSQKFPGDGDLERIPPGPDVPIMEDDAPIGFIGMATRSLFRA